MQGADGIYVLIWLRNARELLDVWSCSSSILLSPRKSYPYVEVHKIHERLATNQIHDHQRLHNLLFELRLNVLASSLKVLGPLAFLLLAWHLRRLQLVLVW